MTYLGIVLYPHDEQQINPNKINNFNNLTIKKKGYSNQNKNKLYR